jgi:hypothetical protein
MIDDIDALQESVGIGQDCETPSEYFIVILPKIFNLTYTIYLLIYHCYEKSIDFCFLPNGLSGHAGSSDHSLGGQRGRVVEQRHPRHAV